MPTCINTFLCLLLLSSTVPAFGKNTILVVGDSLSAAYRIDVSQSWVSLLIKRLQNENSNYQVINASISGDTTSNGLARLPEALKKYKPKITIIALGGNDGLRGLPLNTINNNLDQMILLALAAKSSVLLLGLRLPPNYGPEYTSQFQNIFTTLAKKHGVMVVPLFLHGIDDNPNFMFPNDIHPNAQAQPQLLENVWETLRKML